MITIDRHIEYLLLEHDCVIVPGLGAFVADRRSASIQGTQMLPPHRSVWFNPSIAHNDGLLATSIARHSGLSYDAAMSHLAAAVGALRTQLEQDREFTISRVGTLNLSDEGTITFVPATDPIASLLYKGLPVVDLTVAATELTEDNPSEQPLILAEASPAPQRPAVKADADTVYIPLPRRILKVAACFCLLATIGFVCSTPALNDNATVMASMPGNIRSTSVVDRPAAKQPVRMRLATAPADGMVTVDTTKATVPPPTKKHTAAASPVQPQAVASLRLQPDEHYCIVVASMPSRKRADLFIRQTGNKALRVLEQDGRFRVIAGSASTEDAAKAIARSAEVQNRYPGAWVTER